MYDPFESPDSPMILENLVNDLNSYPDYVDPDMKYCSNISTEMLFTPTPSLEVLTKPVVTPSTHDSRRIIGSQDAPEIERSLPYGKPYSMCDRFESLDCSVDLGKFFNNLNNNPDNVHPEIEYWLDDDTFPETPLAPTPSLEVPTKSMVHTPPAQNSLDLDIDKMIQDLNKNPDNVDLEFEYWLDDIFPESPLAPTPNLKYDLPGKNISQRKMELRYDENEPMDVTYVQNEPIDLTCDRNELDVTYVQNEPIDLTCDKNEPMDLTTTKHQQCLVKPLIKNQVHCLCGHTIQ